MLQTCAPLHSYIHTYRYVKDNGFNPQWNEAFKFKSIFPDLAILRFVVMDDDTLSDDFIGQYSLPLESLAPGQCVCVSACVSCSVCVCAVYIVVNAPPIPQVTVMCISYHPRERSWTSAPFLSM